MDSLITAAARALAAGDPLGALNRVALRDDAPALALRGIAMAQLGDFVRAKALVRRAARAFGSREAVARARCIVAEAEIALASRDLAWPTRALDEARAALEAHGDRINAAHARYLELRHLLLIGRLDDAEERLEELDPADVPPALKSVHALVAAGLFMRRLEARSARAALERARRAAYQARIPALSAEVESAIATLNAPAARLIANGDERLIRLDEVESLMASPALVIDACRHLVGNGRAVVPLASRPVLFSLVRVLGEAWPDDVARDVLLSRAFGARVADESHRARLRVEVGRLRRLLDQIAEVQATTRGFTLAPSRARQVVVLAHPIEVEASHGAVLALLADGQSWSTSSISLALDTSQRTVQRALEALAGDGKVHHIGRGRARRWIAPPLPGFATTLLLPAPFALD